MRLPERILEINLLFCCTSSSPFRLFQSVFISNTSYFLHCILPKLGTMSTLAALKGVGTVLHGRFLVTLPVPTTDIDLSNHVMIVTGANSGLGLESVRHLVRLGVGKVIMAVRTVSKGETARQQVLESVSNGKTKEKVSNIEVWHLDMESFPSIKAFADRAAQLPRLDGVLANAGVMTSKFSLSTGYEKSLTVMLLQHSFCISSYFPLCWPPRRERAIHATSLPPTAPYITWLSSRRSPTPTNAV